MAAEAFLAFPAVDIDSGVFKYVQIRLYRDDGEDTREEKDLVRGRTLGSRSMIPWQLLKRAEG